MPLDMGILEIQHPNDEKMKTADSGFIEYVHE